MTGLTQKKDAGESADFVPWMSAALNGDTERLREIAPRINPAVQGPDGVNALMKAAKFGSADSVAFLSGLYSREEINAADYAERTALHYAAESSMEGAEKTRALLSVGADPLRVDKGLMTPLMCAAASEEPVALAPANPVGALKALLPVSDFDAWNQDGKTALVMAVERLNMAAFEEMALFSPDNENVVAMFAKLKSQNIEGWAQHAVPRFAAFKERQELVAATREGEAKNIECAESDPDATQGANNESNAVPSSHSEKEPRLPGPMRL